MGLPPRAPWALRLVFAGRQCATAPFEAGTGRNAKGERIAAGGRVLNVTASGETLREAVDRAGGHVA